MGYRTDVNNPNPKPHTRKLLGRSILRGLQYNIKPIHGKMVWYMTPNMAGNGMLLLILKKKAITRKFIVFKVIPK